MKKIEYSTEDRKAVISFFATHNKNKAVSVSLDLRNSKADVYTELSLGESCIDEIIEFLKELKK